MKEHLKQYTHEFDLLTELIPSERKQLLKQIADEIVSTNCQAKLVFICTHNSRRSHMSQIWATVFVDHFGLNDIETFSGGTEVTAMNVRVVNALLQAGFGVEDPGGSNPNYKVTFDLQQRAIVCYSKVFDDPVNPKSDFLALMTCSEANEACPIVSGAKKKFSLFYEDPKEADDTPWEGDRYNKRLRQIGIEMYFLMSSVKELKDVS